MANQVAIEKEILAHLDGAGPYGLTPAQLLELCDEADNPDQISYALNTLQKQGRVSKDEVNGIDGALWFLIRQEHGQPSEEGDEAETDPENIPAAMEPEQPSAMFIDLFRLRQPGTNDIQDLTVTLEDGGEGYFAVLATERWVCSPDELRALADRLEAVIAEANQVTLRLCFPY